MSAQVREAALAAEWGVEPVGAGRGLLRGTQTSADSGRPVRAPGSRAPVERVRLLACGLCRVLSLLLYVLLARRP